MEASALTHASRYGLLARRSPLLRLQGDDRLVELIREHHDRAFEVLFDRYQPRLLAFCRGMLGSTEDAEDVLQDVFVNAHAAMLADSRPINVRPWLYRIARNRCLNHLRRPVPEGQESMDVHPDNGTSTVERVQRREELRAIFSDVSELPETQRTAIVLREIDDLTYEEIAEAMGTTLAAVKSLLVRARMSLAEASEARILDCGDVRLQLAEAAEGLRKLDGATRHHLRKCQRCGRYRSELRSSTRALAGIAPVFSLWALKKTIAAKLFGGSSASSAGGASATGAGAGVAGTAGTTAGAGSAAVAGVASSGAAIGGGAAATGGLAGSGIAGGGLATGAIGAVGAKAATGFATAALLTAGAVGVQHVATTSESHAPPAIQRTAALPRESSSHPVHPPVPVPAKAAHPTPPAPAAHAAPAAPAPAPAPAATAPTTAPAPATTAPDPTATATDTSTSAATDTSTSAATDTSTSTDGATSTPVEGAGGTDTSGGSSSSDPGYSSDHGSGYGTKPPPVVTSPTTPVTSPSSGGTAPSDPSSSPDPGAPATDPVTVTTDPGTVADPAASSSGGDGGGDGSGGDGSGGDAVPTF